MRDQFRIDRKPLGFSSCPRGRNLLLGFGQLHLQGLGKRAGALQHPGFISA